MQKDFDRYLKQKQRNRRFRVVLLITLFATAAALSMRECSQSFDEPYNKGYQPVDQTYNHNAMRAPLAS